MRITAATLALFALSISAAAIAPAHADDISPGVRDSGKTYSKEAPNVDYYGTGVGGRLEESAMLRFQIDRLLQDGNYDLAITKARKACQLDPETPENHMLLARAITKRLSSQGGKLDRKLLAEAMGEWKMLWVHDADQDDQWEAKMNYMRLRKTAVALAKRKQAEEKERARARVALAQKVPAEKSASTASRQPGREIAARSASDDKSVGDAQATQQKHKRFWFF